MSAELAGSAFFAVFMHRPAEVQSFIFQTGVWKKQKETTQLFGNGTVCLND